MKLTAGTLRPSLEVGIFENEKKRKYYHDLVYLSERKKENADV